MTKATDEAKLAAACAQLDGVPYIVIAYFDTNKSPRVVAQGIKEHRLARKLLDAAQGALDSMAPDGDD